MIKLKELISEKCWKGYEKKGTKKMFGKTYPNCVKKETVDKLNEKLSKIDIKKMKNKFDKTGKLPPHPMKLAKLMDNIVDCDWYHTSGWEETKQILEKLSD